MENQLGQTVANPFLASQYPEFINRDGVGMYAGSGTNLFGKPTVPYIPPPVPPVVSPSVPTAPSAPTQQKAPTAKKYPPLKKDPPPLEYVNSAKTSGKSAAASAATATTASDATAAANARAGDYTGFDASIGQPQNFQQSFMGTGNAVAGLGVGSEASNLSQLGGYANLNSPYGLGAGSAAAEQNKTEPSFMQSIFGGGNGTDGQPTTAMNALSGLSDGVSALSGLYGIYGQYQNAKNAKQQQDFQQNAYNTATKKHDDFISSWKGL